MMMVVMPVMLMVLIVFVMFVTHCCWFLIRVYPTQEQIHTKISE